jgi:hypothetical protein
MKKPTILPLSPKVVDLSGKPVQEDNSLFSGKIKHHYLSFGKSGRGQKPDKHNLTLAGGSVLPEEK